MDKHDIHYSSKNQEWETPQWLFDDLNKEFNFDTDCCATNENKKCAKFINNIWNDIDWAHSINVFMNPPYSRKIKEFIYRAFNRSLYSKIVLLVPARTDTKWWSIFWDRELHQPKPGVEVRFLAGRLKFEFNGKPMLDKKGKPQAAPFPSAIVIIDRRNIH